MPPLGLVTLLHINVSQWTVVKIYIHTLTGLLIRSSIMYINMQIAYDQELCISSI